GNSGADSNSEEEAVVQEDYKIIESDYIHWDHMPLVYRYKNIGKCTKESVNSMEEALVILEQRTEGAVSFKEYNGQ
ncbi:MAG: hypothetical protein KKE05_02605, partial [Nanoarchaeota archaeon]|nr:hypothetical protein [Nanoarchaeota archaeon]